MNVTRQILAYVDDVNLMAYYIRAIQRIADVLLKACKYIGLAVSMGGGNEIPRSRTSSWHGGTIVSKYYEKLNTFKYLGFLLTNENSIHEEIKCNLKREIYVII